MITRQQLLRDDYLHDFAEFWSNRPETRKIWFSLYTPQQGEETEERLAPEDRTHAIAILLRLRGSFPKIYFTDCMAEGFLRPPQSPEECIFAQVTTCVSADLMTRITPCQLGGRPVCQECGCLASAGPTGLGRYRVGGLVTVANLLAASAAIGSAAHLRSAS